MVGSWMVLPFVLVAAGCSSSRPISPQTPADTPVRMRFASARNVAARTPAGDSILLTDIRELRGTLLSAPADTFHLRIATVHGQFGVLDGVGVGAVVAVLRDPAVRLEARSLDKGRTIGLAGAILGVLAALIAIFIVRTMFSGLE